MFATVLQERTPAAIPAAQYHDIETQISFMCCGRLRCCSRRFRNERNASPFNQPSARRPSVGGPAA
jgi:hypothetical protein